MNRAFKILVYGLVMLGIACYAVADLRVVFGCSMIVLAAGGVWLTEARNGRPLPRLLILLLAGIAILDAAHAAASGMLTVSEFSEFITYLQVIKLYDRRRARDFAQLLSLATFQCIGAMLTSNSLGVGAMLLLFVPGVIAAASLQQVYASRERASRDRRREPRIGVGAHAPRHLVVLVLVASVATAIGGGLTFLLIPRGLGAQRLGEWGNVAVGQATAFTDSVTLGRAGLISESQAEVLDLEVRDRSGSNIGDGDRIFYLRGAVLDVYERGRWTRDDQIRVSPFPIDINRPVPVGGPPRESTLSLKITIRNASERRGYLFTVWRPTQVTYLNMQGVLEVGPDGMLRRESQTGRFEYQVLASPDAGPRRSVRNTPRERSPITERITTLADRILTDAGIEPDPAIRDRSLDAAAARALESYLRERYRYTLEIMAPLPGRDPIEHFIFDAREGHCEYFASALAALCRAVGIPARVVTGYLAAEFNESTRHYLIRESNAHAWVEAQLGDDDWQTLDSTPPADLTRIHRPTLGPLARLRRAFDVLEFAWIDGVVGFDERRRAELVGTTPFDQRKLESRLADMNSRVSTGGVALAARALRNGLIAFGLVAIVGVGLALSWRLFKPRLAWLSRRARTRRVDPELASLLRGAGYFAEMEAALADAGMERPLHAPPLEHMKQLAARAPDVSKEAIPLIELYYRARFGRQPLSAAESGQARSRVGAMRHLLARKRPKRGS